MASPYNPAQTGNYEFALKLAKNLSESEDGSDQKTNLFFSPASISLVLAMCQYGADGQTKRQMEEKIFGPDSKGEEISRWIIETLKLELESKKSQVYVLKFANRIYANANLSLKTTFVDEIVQIFKSTALNVDFGKNGDKTADEINAWVEEVTNHRIKDLVPKGLLNAETSTLLVDEKGTEAAAASFAKMVPQCLFISNEGPKVFTADHPFLFILKAGGYEHEATILFLGEFYGRDRQS
uniref:Serpin domain-containing protein n=1 Tax=Romanomermis culicivorax TaxID=13658 RepID=A0A915KMH7_ROMCU